MQITKPAWFLLSHLYLVPRSEETRSVGISWHILQPTKDHALSVFNMLGFDRDPKQVVFFIYGHIQRLQDFWILWLWAFSGFFPEEVQYKGLDDPHLRTSDANVLVGTSLICIISWVWSSYSMSTTCVLYYVSYECDLRDAKCGFWRSLHNDFEFAGGSFDWVGGQGLGRWSSRQVGEKLRSRRCAMRMRSTLKIHIAGDNTKGNWVKRLFPICPLSFLKESQRGAKGAFMANRAGYMSEGKLLSAGD